MKSYADLMFDEDGSGLDVLRSIRNGTTVIGFDTFGEALDTAEELEYSGMDFELEQWPEGVWRVIVSG